VRGAPPPSAPSRAAQIAAQLGGDLREGAAVEGSGQNGGLGAVQHKILPLQQVEQKQPAFVERQG
jgi:hypothetical protein